MTIDLLDGLFQGVSMVFIIGIFYRMGKIVEKVERHERIINLKGFQNVA
jgi:hypothetical protein